MSHSERAADLKACQFCFGRFRGPGYYCRPACEASAAKPAGNDLKLKSRAYTSP